MDWKTKSGLRPLFYDTSELIYYRGSYLTKRPKEANNGSWRTMGIKTIGTGTIEKGKQ